jgi:hypothetical protein
MQHVYFIYYNIYKKNKIIDYYAKFNKILFLITEALEAHYDHPPSTFRIDPTIGQRLSGHDLVSPADCNNATSSLSELWDAVVASASNNAQEEEHVYDEIPCWRSRQSESSGHHMVTKC